MLGGVGGTTGAPGGSHTYTKRPPAKGTTRRTRREPHCAVSTDTADEGPALGPFMCMSVLALHEWPQQAMVPSVEDPKEQGKGHVPSPGRWQYLHSGQP